MSLLKTLLVIAGGLVAHVLLAMLSSVTPRAISIGAEFRWLGAGLLLSSLLLLLFRPAMIIGIVVVLAVPLLVDWNSKPLARLLPLGNESSRALAEQIEVSNCRDQPIDIDGTPGIEVSCTFEFPKRRGVRLGHEPQFFPGPPQERRDELHFSLVETIYQPPPLAGVFQGGAQEIIKRFRIEQRGGSARPFTLNGIQIETGRSSYGVADSGRTYTL